MRCFMSLLVLAATASCASSGSSPGSGIATPSERIVAMDNQAVYRTTVQPNAKVLIPVAPSRAFEAVRAVYEELGVPTGTFSGAIADNYRIYISLISAVRPDGTGASELETAFSAQAQNMDGAASDKVACGTTGRLEERIRKSVLLKAGATPQ